MRIATTFLIVLLAGCGGRTTNEETAESPAADDVSARIEAIAGRLADGSVTPEQALLDPAHDDLRSVQEFKGLLRRHARASKVRMTRSDEPGDPLVVEGRLVTTEGDAVAGELVYAFQTDAAGRYHPEQSDAEDRVRLFAWLRTDEKGRFRLTTIVPGAYAHAPSVPRHIHFQFRPKSLVRSRGSGPPSLFFEDDPLLTKAHRDEIAHDGAVIASTVEKDGVRHCTYEMVFRSR